MKHKIPLKKREYEPPELQELKLLDESVKGYGSEPPQMPQAPPDNDRDQFDRDMDRAIGG
ncbi:MAG: hypothetical protein P9X24_08200 [Candidatus Hatepunaea meridiana]|nr:hypothetical protein [Candidatus Hatepunaea meridiana]